MKSITVAVLVLAAFANAQNPPQCATDCVAKTPTSCSQSDLSCLCHDQTFITGATQCIITTCQGPDVQAAEQFAQGLCASVGVTLTSTPPIPTSTSGTSGSGTASSDSGTATAPSTPSGTQASAPSPSTSDGSAAGLEAGFTGLIGAALAFFVL